MNARDMIAEIVSTEKNARIVQDEIDILNGHEVADAVLAALPDHVRWAADQCQREVANRPLSNIHRRTLDDTWRQERENARKAFAKGLIAAKQARMDPNPLDLSAQPRLSTYELISRRGD